MSQQQQLEKKHKEFNDKFEHLLKDDTRTIPHLDKSTNIQEILGYLQETGRIFNLNQERNNVHNAANDTVQYSRFALGSSTDENND